MQRLFDKSSSSSKLAAGLLLSAPGSHFLSNAERLGSGETRKFSSAAGPRNRRYLDSDPRRYPDQRRALVRVPSRLLHAGGPLPQCRGAGVRPSDPGRDRAAVAVGRPGLLRLLGLPRQSLKANELRLAKLAAAMHHNDGTTQGLVSTLTRTAAFRAVISKLWISSVSTAISTRCGIGLAFRLFAGKTAL
jgi:hypothetical protein